MTLSNEFKQIVEGDYCIGCGLCATASKDRIKIQFNSYGQYVPTWSDADIEEDEISNILDVCPFSNRGPDESNIAENLYKEAHQDEVVGRYRTIFAGYCDNTDIRERGSSGGVATWVLRELLENHNIDGVVHVSTDYNSKITGRLFKFTVSKSVEEVLAAGKSKYYPVELSEVLREIRNKPGRYVIVGLPCFIKGVRRLSAIDPEIRDSIVYYIGLVCGHLKSKGFAEALAWSKGVIPSKIENFEFRTKIEGLKASDYGFTLRSNEHDQVYRVKEFIGADWGLGFFKYNACDYCDDIFAETADLVIGDAWLPEYVGDYRGTSLVVVRTKFFEELLTVATREKKIKLEQLSVEKARDSQAAGVRHRRSGLSYRLRLKLRKREWFPRKRVYPGESYLGIEEKILQHLRLRVKSASHEALLSAKKGGNFQIFVSQMRRWIALNNLVLKFRRILKKFK